MNSLGINIEPGTVVVVYAENMDPPYRNLPDRLFICKGGFGLQAFTNGGFIGGDYILPGASGYTDGSIRGNMIERLATREEVIEAWQKRNLKLEYLEDRDADNPMAKCPACGHKGKLMDSFSLINQGFNGIKDGPEAHLNLQECGTCGALLEW